MLTRCTRRHINRRGVDHLVQGGRERHDATSFNHPPRPAHSSNRIGCGRPASGALLDGLANAADRAGTPCPARIVSTPASDRLDDMGQLPDHRDRRAALRPASRCRTPRYSHHLRHDLDSVGNCDEPFRLEKPDRQPAISPARHGPLSGLPPTCPAPLRRRPERRPPTPAPRRTQAERPPNPPHRDPQRLEHRDLLKPEHAPRDPLAQRISPNLPRRCRPAPQRASCVRRPKWPASFRSDSRLSVKTRAPLMVSPSHLARGTQAPTALTCAPRDSHPY